MKMRNMRDSAEESIFIFDGIADNLDRGTRTFYLFTSREV